MLCEEAGSSPKRQAAVLQAAEVFPQGTDPESAGAGELIAGRPRQDKTFRTAPRPELNNLI